MNYPIRKLSAASRKRVTRRTIQQLCYLRKWWDEALCAANAAEFDGDYKTAVNYEMEAIAISQEIRELEGSIL